MDAGDLHKIKLCVFNEEILLEHYMKVMVGCGAFLGFRSIEEHVQLQVGDFSYGTFCPDHEFGGLDYVKIDVLRGSKGGRKLSVHSVYYKDTKNMMRIPIFTVETLHLYPGLTLDSCLGGSLTRLITRVSSGQIRLYCYPVKGTQDPDPTRPLGRAKINSLHKQSAMKLGLDMTFFSGGHAWRKLFCTVLANDPNISLAEGMKASRHSSVSNHLGYTTADNGTEASRWNAFMSGASKVHDTDDLKEEALDKKPSSVPADEKVDILPTTIEYDLGCCDEFDSNLLMSIENGAIFNEKQENKVTALVEPTNSLGLAQLKRSPHMNKPTVPVTPQGSTSSSSSFATRAVARETTNVIKNPYITRKVTPETAKEKAMKQELQKKIQHIQDLERRIRDFNVREEEMTHMQRGMANETLRNFEDDCNNRIRDVEEMAAQRESRYRNHIRRLSLNLEDYRVRLADMEQIYDFDERASSHPSRN